MNEYDRQLLAEAMEGAANAILITDRNGRIEWANPAFCRHSGYSLDELLGKTPALLNSGAQPPEFYEQLWNTVLKGEPWQGELLERARDGHHYRVNQVITPLMDDQGQVSHLLAIQHSFTQADHERSLVNFEARHDALTRLPNRRLLFDRMAQVLQDPKQSSVALAVMFIDLDKFKPVNDAYGHSYGDKLLIAVAGRLRSGVRKSDLVARLSGDEFVILILGPQEVPYLEALAAGLVRRIARPYRIDGRTCALSASIGIARYPENGTAPEALLAAADAAMYQVKQRGGNAHMMANSQLSS
ncbi:MULTISPECIES: GGDEF domain-containing protein [unclassified Pseudomonas]|uniref:GGDEF domain-containing protein n=1 Tax=unclassified Pseudomonas TaxID=196821 RepID=UPI000EA8ACA6|nr:MULTISPECIES: GGDEF domain-containing protein [unclassified Pseudomonas]AYF85789.1 sensor domain-containing diguanylate cyclase [Pseudomonas sp. DY-1]MDH4654979.1 sensor domain-containing diguanylate cyclase [Pseudomonas sp. BN606]MRK19470.1 sensor domain-containing diguanylate cyclase [Pseudomonas sp. JG-B]